MFVVFGYVCYDCGCFGSHSHTHGTLMPMLTAVVAISFGISIPAGTQKKVVFLWPIRKVFLRGQSENILFNKTRRVQLKWLFSQRPEGRKTKIEHRVVVATVGVNICQSFGIALKPTLLIFLEI